MNQSGWYQNDEGDSFHVHGEHMSDATIWALGELVKAAKKAIDQDMLWEPQLGERVRVKIDANFEYSNDEAKLAFFRAGFVGTLAAINHLNQEGLEYRVEVPGGYAVFGKHELMPWKRIAE